MEPSGGMRTLSLPEGSRSRASRSRSQESGEAQKTTATCGPRCSTLFGLFDPAGSLARTFTESLIGRKGWSSNRCALTWRRQDTRCSRTLYRLAVSALPHRRDRCWFVAHRTDAGTETMRERSNGVHADSIASDTPCLGRITRRSKSNRTIQNEKIGANIYVPVERSGSKRTFTDPDSERCEECNASGQSGHTQGRTTQEGDAKRRIPDWNGFPTQPPVCGGDDGFPGELAGIAFPRWRREAVKACGNAIVPQVALQIFETINEYEKI